MSISDSKGKKEGKIVHVINEKVPQRVTVNMGDFSEFNPTTMEWNIYKEKLDSYFISNDIKDDKKMSAFLRTRLDNETYKLLKDLADPKQLFDLEYKELCTFLTSHFGKPVSIFHERREFYDLKEIESETMNEWYGRIKHKASTCKFGKSLDEVLRDKFITGMKEGPILNRLAEEEETITMEDALKLAIKREVTVKISSHEINKLSKSYSHNKNQNQGPRYETNTNKNIHSFKSNEYETNTNKNPHPFKSNEHKSGSTFACFRCGNKNHNAHQCFYKNHICSNCKKRGHISYVCNSKNLNYITDDDDFNYPLDLNVLDISDECVKNFTNDFIRDHKNSDNEIFMDVNTMYVLDENKPIEVEIKFIDQTLKMQIDTGATVSVIPADVYRKIFSQQQLMTSALTFRGYTGELIQPLGKIIGKLQYQNQIMEMEIHVVEQGKSLLLARDFLKKFGIVLKNINFIENNRLNKLLTEYNEIFDEVPGRFKYEQVHLKLNEDTQPIYVKPRTIPYSMKQKVDNELERLQRNGIITLVDTNPWATPIVPVTKSDGSVRLCGDYKVTLNKFLEQDRHPMPRIEEIFNSLRGGKKFSKIDLREAYSQLELDDESKKLCAWSTTKGIFVMNRMPYGITPASAKFQRFMEKLLLGLKKVTVFIDDITITGDNDDEHLDNLEAVFKRLKGAGLTVKIDKCEFFKTEVNFLGCIIDSNGIRKSKDKISAILEAPVPTTVTQVKSFAGMVNHYSQFVPNLSQIMNPIYNLTKNGVDFVWSEECQKAFDEIKKIITSDIVLVHFNPDLPIILEVDASNDGIAAVIKHKFPNGVEKPIAYGSRTLTSAESNYSMVDKEGLACIFGVKRFSDYLYGFKFIIRTDHKPLITLFGENKSIPIMAARRIHRWAIFLAGFNYKIEHIKGTRNVVADMLSRLPVQIKNKDQTDEDKEVELSYLNQLDVNKAIDAEVVREFTEKDKILQDVIKFVQNGWPKKNDESCKYYFNKQNELYLQNGVLMWGYRVVIPAELQNNILLELHSSHMGIVKTKSLARSYVWWPKIDDDIERMVNNCHSCAMVRVDPPKATLCNWPVPDGPWERLHIDFAGPVLGYMYLVIIDAYSKWVDIFPMRSITTINTIEILYGIFARYGLPSLIVSDNATTFTSGEWKNFLSRNGVNQITSPPGHPQSNGMAENAVKNFKSFVTKILHDPANRKMSVQVAIAKYLITYRNVEQCTTGEAPAKLLMGRKLKISLDLLKPKQKITAIKSKEETVKKGRTCSFKIGETAMVRDYRKVNKKSWCEAKVVKIIGRQTYIVETVEGKSWKRHLNQMIKFKSEVDKNQPIDEEVAMTSNPASSNIKYFKNNFAHSQISSPLRPETIISQSTEAPLKKTVRRDLIDEELDVHDINTRVLRPRTPIGTS